MPKNNVLLSARGCRLDTYTPCDLHTWMVIYTLGSGLYNCVVLHIHVA